VIDLITIPNRPTPVNPRSVALVVIGIEPSWV